VELRKLFSVSLEKPRLFNFRLTSMIYSFNWIYNGKNLYLILDYNLPIVAKISEKERELNATIYSLKNTVSQSEVVEKIEKVLGFDEKIEEFYNKIKEDPLLKYVPIKLKGARLRSVDPWTGLVVAVCQQNASFKQGWRMLYNLYKKVGKILLVEDHYVIALPRPKELVKLDASLLAECKLGYRSQTLIEAAKFFLENSLEEKLPRESPISAEKILKEIKGVGQYSARLTLVLSMRYYELPPIDRWTAKIAQEAYKLPSATIKTIESALKEKWGRWAGLGVFFLTVVLDAVPLSKALMRLKENNLKPSFSAKDLTPLNLWSKMI